MLEGTKGRSGQGWARALLVGAGALGCAAEPHAALAPQAKPAPVVVAPAAPAKAPEPPLAPLRTGALAPVENAPLDLTVTAHANAGAYELVQLTLPSGMALVGQTQGGGPQGVSLDTLRGSTVTLEPALDSFAFVEWSRMVEPGVSKPVLWIRRKKSGAPLVGTIFTGASWGGPGHRVPFHATLDASKPPTPKLEVAWATAAVEYLQTSTSPVWAFAANHLRTRYLPKERTPNRAALSAQQGGGSELSRLMGTTTGRISVERALAQDRELFLRAAQQKPSVPLAKLTPPRLAQHPWAEMSAKLGTSAPDEPLARAAPAEFYFVRAKDFAKLMDLLDLVDDFGEPAADLLDGQAQSRGTLARYDAELGLARSALTRALGPAIVSELALVGSDPYIHEGSDLTLIFRVKDAGLFASALTGTLARHAALHPNVTETTFTEGAVTVSVHRSGDGRIRQHRARVGDLELVSNSATAKRRVLMTIAGQHPRLADEPDFRYMLARDAALPNDELAYLGDRFVASVVGPAQKIAEARRQLALGELLTPGYAALTLGLLDGRSPQKTSELVLAKLLAPGKLKHADGSLIDWAPGQAARSNWGTPAALEPLLDRPAFSVVTEAERLGYQEFARSYERDWSDRIDPIALRVREEKSAGRATTLVGELRILPTLRTEYWETINTVGNVHLAVPALLPGLSGLIGIGQEARLRHALSNAAGLFGVSHIEFDWLGDYALVGTTSRNELANALHHSIGRRVELPPSDDESTDLRFEESLANLPVYAAIGVKSRLAAGVFLTAVRNMAREAAPGVATWTNGAAYRGNEVVAVKVTEHHVAVTLYYSLTKDALVLSLNEGVLHQVIDQLTDRPPQKQAKGAAETADSAQFVTELSGDPQSALYRALAWLTTAALVEGATGSRDLAQSFLLGTQDLDPKASDALMRAYLGTLAVTPDGSSYVLAADGVRDPARGTLHAPIYPELPSAGSALERVLRRLSRLRSALSFDDEPVLGPNQAPMQSLHARVTLELR